MAFTADQLAAVEAALASGELTVKFGERLVTYRSVDDLQKVRNNIRADLIAAGTIAAPVRTSYITRTRD